MEKWREALAVLMLTLLLAGCSFSNLQFVQDTRLKVIAPKSEALVKLPLTLRWTIKDYSPEPAGEPSGANRGYFAIFVDRAPVRPGQTLRVLASGNNACLHTPGCPDAQELASLQVYTTASTQFTLRTVDSLNSYQQVQLHEAVIVLMDTTGHRIGESAWYIDFRLRQGT